MPPPYDPDPKTLWTFLVDGKVAACEIRFVPNGVEVRMLRNGALLHSQVFPSGEEALAFAEEEKGRTIDSSRGL